MPKFWQQALGAALAILLVVLLPISTVSADTKPYFRTLNGGPFAGGWFGDGCSASADYQSPYKGASFDPYKGAIMGFLDLGNGGASSNLDAFATGLIEGETTAPDDKYGFSTGLPSAGPGPTGSRSLSFSNVAPSSPSIGDFWGGILEGASGGEHCIPDYFGTKDTNIVGSWNGINYIESGQRTSSSTDMPAGVIPSGNKLIIFVNGNVQINGNITYGSNNLSSVPKFAVIAKGNIYISPNVTQLDGWYIAQPTSGSSGGVIWTCSNGTEPLPDTYLRTTPGCSTKLTINGALTAKQVNLSRIGGNIGTVTSAEDVNFTAAMVLGGPFFEETTSGGGSSSAGTIQSLISLPPVF